VEAVIDICALLVVGLRSAGDLQFLELASYDVFLRVKERHTVPEPRLILVQIVEQDIQRIRQWPPSDDRLADLLQKLLDYSPRVIGVDLYRDFPVPPYGAAECAASTTRVDYRHEKSGDAQRPVLGPEFARHADRFSASRRQRRCGAAPLFLDDGQNFYMSLLICSPRISGRRVLPQAEPNLSICAWDPSRSR
jgi:CHASE2 domain-containing sensor protein